MMSVTIYKMLDAMIVRRYQSNKREFEKNLCGSENTQAWARRAVWASYYFVTADK
jgi:hypothetical protein